MGWIPDWKPQLYRPEQVQVGARGAAWGYVGLCGAVQGRMGAACDSSLHQSQGGCGLTPTSVTAISVMGESWRRPPWCTRDLLPHGCHVPLSIPLFRSLTSFQTRRLPGRTWQPSTQPSGAWTKVGAMGARLVPVSTAVPPAPPQLCPSVRRDRAGPGGAAACRLPQQHAGDLHFRQRHPLPQRQDQPVPVGHRRAPAGLVPGAHGALGAGQPGLRLPPG